MFLKTILLLRSKAAAEVYKCSEHRGKEKSLGLCCTFGARFQKHCSYTASCRDRHISQSGQGDLEVLSSSGEEKKNPRYLVLSVFKAVV